MVILKNDGEAGHRAKKMCFMLFEDGLRQVNSAYLVFSDLPEEITKEITFWGTSCLCF